MFNGKITSPFTKEELESIFSEGKKRYEEKIPPGYEDEKNKDDTKKYGDLVLWKQVIQKANELQKDVIFITDERKIDWWWKLKDGRIMGPRQELIAEIKEIANVNFHMYSSERFLSYGQTFLKEKINQSALKEIETMKLAEMEIIRNEKKYKYNIRAKDNIRNELKILTKQIEELDYVINNMDSDLASLNENKYFHFHKIENNQNEYMNDYKILIEHRKEMILQRENILKKLDNLKKIFNYLGDK